MLELTASPDIPAQYDEGKQATRPLLYFKCDACDLTQAISEEEAKNVVRCRLCGNEIHRSKKTPSGVTPTKVSKLCITAEVDERRAVVHFVSSEVTQPHEVEVALKEIQEVADQFEVRLLVINFTHVPHPSSSFLGKLIALYKRLSGEGIQLRLCCMSLEAENIYKIMNLAKLAPLYATEEAALKE
jgi:anti-anti-sigma factor